VDERVEVAERLSDVPAADPITGARPDVVKFLLQDSLFPAPFITVLTRWNSVCKKLPAPKNAESWPVLRVEENLTEVNIPNSPREVTRVYRRISDRPGTDSRTDCGGLFAH